MSEDRTLCHRFDAWLLDGGTEFERTACADHVASCTECQAQRHAHVMLAEAFVNEDVPLLSPAFETKLDRTLAAAVEVRPLKGWRRAAMLGYAAAAVGGLGWMLRGVPLPLIDPSSPWVAAVALIAVPVTFLLAIRASRWMPRVAPL